MELIYVFMGEVRGDEFNLEFSLSDNFFVKYDKEKKELKINKKMSTISPNFFGENIVNINAIIGKNGAGKSTLLSLLGLNDYDRRSTFSLFKWFAIYHLENDLFAIEGRCKELLMQVPEYLKEDSFCYFYLNEINNDFEYFLHDEAIKKIYKSKKILHFPNSNDNANYFGENNLPFYREYLTHQKKWLYKYLIDKYVSLDPKIIKKKIKLKIESHFKSNKISDCDALKIYLDINGFYTESSIFPNKDKKNRIKNEKELFIIHMLEVLINNYMIESIKNEIKSEIDQSINKEDAKRFLNLNSELYNDELNNFEKIKTFLLAKLYKFIDIANDIYGIETEVNFKLIVEFLEKIPEQNFSNSDRYFDLNIDLDTYDNNVFDLLEESEKICLVKPFEVNFPGQSDGEIAILRKLSSLYSSIESNIDKIDYFLILIDEVEKNLHPEWSRCFLSMLLELLKKYDGKASFQLLLTTHSPYLISDLPKNNILKIYQDSGEIFVSPSLHGFGSNIYDILNDNFFLSSPMGEFAKIKINQVIDFLRNNENNNEINLESAKEIINMVDDPVLKECLFDEYVRKLSNQNDKVKEIEALTARIEYLKSEI